MVNQKLRNARKHKRWSIETAAEKAQVTWRTYFRWEHGTQKPHPYNLDQLVEAFRMSPEDLGLEPETDSPTPYPNVTRVARSADVVTSSTVDMFELAIISLILARQQYQWTLDDLRLRVEVAIRRLDDMERQNGENISRREALRFLVGLPVAFVGFTQAGTSAPALAVEEVLPLYVTSIPACWRLFFSGDLAEVEHVLPSCISHLTTLAQEPSKYQKSAASLASQAHQLGSLITLEHEDFGTSLTHCKQAFFYGQIADDPNLQAASLIRQVNTLYYRKRYTQILQTLQEAEHYAGGASPLIRGRIYSDLAASYARHERKQEADRYMGLSHDITPDRPEDDPAFLYTHTDHYILYLNDTLSYLRFDRPDDARKAITRAATFVPHALSPRRIELLNHQLSVVIAQGDLDLSRVSLEAAIKSGRTLGSDLYLSETHEIYQQQMLPKWPYEQQVKALADLFH